MNPEIAWYTWSSDEKHPLLQLMLDSAKRHNIEFTVISCDSLLNKLTTLRTALSAVDESQIIVCADAYDVLCLVDEDTFLKKFLDLNTKLIFGAEKTCHHHYPETKAFFDANWAVYDYRYANAGLYAGFAGRIVAMIDEILAWPLDELKDEFVKSKADGSFNDQTLVGRYLTLHSDVHLDCDCRLFWNLYGEYQVLNTAIQIQDGTLTKKPDIKPCFAHFTQVKMHYPILLDVAYRLGIELTSSNVDLQLFDDYSKQRVDGIVRYPVELTPAVIQAINAIPAYQLLRARNITKRMFTRFKVNAGKVLLNRK